MALSKDAFVRSTAALLLLGLVTLLVIVSLTGWLTLRTQGYSREVFRARQVRTALVEARSLLQDAETGQRGFLLTQAQEYLQPYEAGVARMRAAVDRLASLTPPEDAALVTRLRAVIDTKLDELSETVGLAHRGLLIEAMNVVRTGRGKILMDEARALFGELLGRIDTRLNTRMDDQNSSIEALKWSVFAGAVLITFVVGGSAWIAARYTRELLTARGQLVSINAGLERRVEERTADLSRANDELQRFAYLVSHDLRSPLVNVMGFTSELEGLRKEFFALLHQRSEPAGLSNENAERQLGTEFDEAIGFIKASISKMDGLIAAILKLSRDGQRTFAPETLDVRAVVENAAANVRYRLSERGGDIQLVGDFPALHSDRIAIEQIVGNLVDNAVKYSDPSRAPQIVVTGERVSGGFELSVADNGRGIAAGDQERVFELFRRAGKQDQPGEGIGLAYVRASVRRLGGDIVLMSKPGEGSTFKVVLRSHPKRS